jgi:hypothetical protein
MDGRLSGANASICGTDASLTVPIPAAAAATGSVESECSRLGGRQRALPARSCSTNPLSPSRS